MRIGVIGCGRVLPAHLAGIRQVLEKGVAEATITALCSGHIEKRAHVPFARGRDHPARAGRLGPGQSDVDPSRLR